MIKTISAAELNEKLKKDEVILIDVRETSEHQIESIAGSQLIPLGQLTASKLPSKEKTIVTQCRFGRRSEEARQKLLREDPTLEVYSLEGGITAWREQGYPVQSSQ